MPGESRKTFYLQTFGCQMNVHDSEKVIGTLMSEGYEQVQTVEEADLVLYNTCSIRDKAEQKVFHRLNDYKKFQKQGKKFGVLGCVAQQEGEKIFERAPHVSMVCGSASYRNLPSMLVQIEAGKRVTGLDDRETDECFETEFTSRSNAHRGYITIIEGCDKFCAYCVVPFTRGKERSRTSSSVLSEARPEDQWSGREGFVHRAVMEDFPDLSAFQVYACGAPVMVDAARSDFTHHCGLAPTDFFADSFVTAADVAAEAEMEG